MDLDELPQPTRETTVPVDKLDVDGENPNEQSDEMFGLLCENMRNHGWLGNAIVCNEDYVIADGEHRWRAAQEIGLDEVPVKVYEIDEPTRRLWRQELNKISGEHDTKRDALEYDFLLDNGKSDEVSELVDASGEDLDELLAEIRMDNSSPVAYDYDVEHNVHFMDCIEGMQEHVPDDSVDMVFTSPPYNVEKTKTQGRESETVDYEDNKSAEEFRSFIKTVVSELDRVVKPDGHIFINLDPMYNEGYIESHQWLRDSTSRELKSKIIWNKKQGHRPYLPKKGQFQRDYEPIYHFSASTNSLNDLGAKCVWNITPSVNATEVNESHPAPFPTELVTKSLEATASEGDTVLDPFMGSGTTAVAAIEYGCNYVGFELDEQGAYKPIIERRIQEATRQTESPTNAASND